MNTRFLHSYLCVAVCLFAAIVQSAMPASPVVPAPSASPVPEWLAVPPRFEVRPELPHDFVVLLDNSASIKGDQQVWLRECVQLLTELVDPEDHLSLVLFGRQASLAANLTIAGDASRKELKAILGKGIDFTEQRSDITAALDLLADKRAEVFRKGKALPAIVLLTDGFLEPDSEPVDVSYRRLVDRRQKDFAGVPFYAIGLGTTQILRPLPNVPGATGMTLLRDQMAQPAGQFFHAKDLDQVLPTLLEILKSAKGGLQLTEGLRNFRMDDSCENLLFILRKGISNEKATLDSQDLALLPPSGPAIDLQSVSAGVQSGIQWDRDYRFFDVIRISKPMPGQWQIRLAKDDPSALLGKYRVHTRLVYDPAPAFALNEYAVLWAGVDDDRTSGTLVREQLRLQLKCDAEASFAQTNRFAELKAYSTQGVYGVDLAAWAAAQSMKPGVYRAQIIAQKPNDPNFLRASPAFAVTIAEDRFEWRLPTRSEAQFVPFLRTAFSLGFRMGPAIRQSLVGQPDAFVDLYGSDPRRGQKVPWMGGDPGAARLAFETQTLSIGEYFAVFRITGRSATGDPVSIVSQPQPFEVSSLARAFWIVVGSAAAIVGLLLLQVLWFFATVRLRGRFDYSVWQGGKEVDNGTLFLPRNKRRLALSEGSFFLSGFEAQAGRADESGPGQPVRAELVAPFALLFTRKRPMIRFLGKVNLDTEAMDGRGGILRPDEWHSLSNGEKIVVKTGSTEASLTYFR